MSEFCYPDSIQVDKALKVGLFKDYIDRLGIPVQPVPPGRHSKNAIESKQYVISSVSLPLKEAAGEDFGPMVRAYKAKSISNDLFGNDTISQLS